MGTTQILFLQVCTIYSVKQMFTTSVSFVSAFRVFNEDAFGLNIHDLITFVVRSRNIWKGYCSSEIYTLISVG